MSSYSTVIAQLVYTLGGSNFAGANGSMMIEVVVRTAFLHCIFLASRTSFIVCSSLPILFARLCKRELTFLYSPSSTFLRQRLREISWAMTGPEWMA